MLAEEVVPAMVTKAQMTKQEKEWRAKDDAHILADSEVIKGDAVRLKDAKVAAAKMAEEEKDKAAAMSRIAKMRKTKSLSSDEGDGEKKSKRAKPKPKNPHNVFNKI